MLYLVGTGLWRWDDISIRGMNICKKADKIVLDGYTRNFDQEELDKLEKEIGKKIEIANRKELEETLGFLNTAKKANVVLLVPGNPLVATTHITILMEAKSKGIDVEIVHGSSIYSALPGEAGLQMYKLGGSCTIPSPEKNIKPYSVYEKIEENIKRGLHTLVLLDTSPKKELCVKEALKIMLEIENERRKEVCTNKTKIIVGCRLGAKNQKILYKTIDELIKMDLPGPCTLIFPGKLHFIEEEYLKMI